MRPQGVSIVPLGLHVPLVRPPISGNAGQMPRNLLAAERQHPAPIACADHLLSEQLQKVHAKFLRNGFVFVKPYDALDFAAIQPRFFNRLVHWHEPSS